MRRNYFFMAFAALVMLSCQKEVNSFSPLSNNDVNDSINKICIPISFSGDYVQTSEEPMNSKMLKWRTRAGDEEAKTYYAVSVLSYIGLESSPYAFGLFDDPTKINVIFDKSKPYYVIEALVIKDPGDVLFHNDKTFYAPFLLDTDEESSLDNQFVYSSTKGFDDLRTLGVAKSTLEQYSFPRVERFYGSTGDANKRWVDATKISGAITLNLKRCSFGTKVTVNPPDIGTVTVKYLDQTITVANDESAKTKQGIYSFNDLNSLISTSTFAPVESHSEQFTINIEWQRMPGEALITQSQTITARRNIISVVNINFNSNDSKGINMSLENTDMTESSQDWDVNVE